jgi:threonine aldolase
MHSLDRRRFLELGALGGTLGLAVPATALAGLQGQPGSVPTSDDSAVRLSGDGLGLTAAQYARLLGQLADEGIATDSYSIGGVVEELETSFARLLGKERAVFMPTGTLANHLAVRTLAAGRGRVVVQADSHFYMDEGDCAQTLSRLNLVPLGASRASFTADEVEEVVADTRSGRVATPVSVISIESPVRRHSGEQFELGALQRVVALARREGIRLHLDGARLFLQAAYTGEVVAETARPFDTVYVSLYKYFNAASGAILAGPRALLDEMFHERRMFGGGLPSVWPYAAVALHYLDGFSDRFARAVGVSEDLVAGLAAHDEFSVERVTPGTNLFWLRVAGIEPVLLRSRLAAENVLLPAPRTDGRFLIGVNETLNRSTAETLVECFSQAVRA